MKLLRPHPAYRRALPIVERALMHEFLVSHKYCSFMELFNPSGRFDRLTSAGSAQAAQAASLRPPPLIREGYEIFNSGFI